MAFYSCDTAIPSQGDKGSSVVYLGYIADLAHPGNCIAVSELETSGAKVVSEKCDIGCAKQNWQFSADTFFNYFIIDFLGKTKGPYPSGKNTNSFPFMHSSPGYSFDHNATTFTVNYNAKKFHGSTNHTLAFDIADWNANRS
jgi:hypothetical protein